jgi:hypothetical protein
MFCGVVLCLYAQWFALAPGIAREQYGGAGVFGVVETIAGLRAVCGAVASLRWRPSRPLATGLALTLAWPLQCLVFALGAPLAIVIPCGFAAGWASLMMIWWETALAQHPAPPASRVSSYDWMGSLALPPVGYPRGIWRAPSGPRRCSSSAASWHCADSAVARAAPDA